MKLRRLIRPLGLAMSAAELAWVARQHWQTIPSERRERLGDLVRRSRGKPSNLSHAERAEIRELVRGLELPRLARRSAGVLVGARRRARKAA